MTNVIEILKQKPEPSETQAIFDLMKTLREINPADTWLDNYQMHLAKRGASFFDTYHCMQRIGAHVNPKNILEIGCRSGISICQLLCRCTNFQDKKVVLFDLFDDGFLSPELVSMNLRHLKIPTDMVEFVVGISQLTMPKFKLDNPGLKFDYILVDGEHSTPGAWADLVNISDMLNPGGIVLFDDIGPDGCDLLPVWNQWKALQGDRFAYHEDMNGKGVGVAVKM